MALIMIPLQETYYCDKYLLYCQYILSQMRSNNSRHVNGIEPYCIADIALHAFYNNEMLKAYKNIKQAINKCREPYIKMIVVRQLIEGVPEIVLLPVLAATW